MRLDLADQASSLWLGRVQMPTWSIHCTEWVQAMLQGSKPNGLELREKEVGDWHL